MPGSNRRFTLAAVALPLLLLAMAGLSRGATIVVNTLAGGTVPLQVLPPFQGPCSLSDAVAAANAGGRFKYCVGGSGANTITFSVTGTITLAATLIVKSNLTIIGPTGSPGITISGGGRVQLINLPLGPNYSAAPGTLNLQLLTLTNATGSAIFNGGTLTVSNCTFSGNQAGADGGGAIFNEGYTVTITNSTFTNNTGQTGSAISNGGGPINVIDCTFWHNQTPSPQAVPSGVICSGGSEGSIKGSILADNIGGNCCVLGYGFGNEGYNISDDATCHFGTGTGANGLTFGDNINPMLASGLANNGGPTETIALLKGSPAIMAVPFAKCAVATDQRGFPRPSPGYYACDIGAYEFQPLCPPGEGWATSGNAFQCMAIPKCPAACKTGCIVIPPGVPPNNKPRSSGPIFICKNGQGGIGTINQP